MLPLQVILYSMKTIKINIDSVESYLLAIVFISNSIQPTIGRGSYSRQGFIDYLRTADIFGVDG